MDARLTCCLATLTLIGAPAAAYDEVTTAIVVAGGAGEGSDAQWREGHAIEVRSENGEVSVVIDGKPVPADRIRHEDGRVVIVDEQGKEHPLFGMLMGEHPGHGAFTFRFAGPGEEGEEPFAFTWDGVKYEPKVMLGIHLDQPGAALEKHLGLEPGATTMISGLYKGLAGDNAGLGLYDVITAIDGKTPANPGALVEALAQHEPGDVVVLAVVQAGKTRKVQVTVDAYDRQRMEGAELEGSPQVRWVGGSMFQPGFELKELLVDPQHQDWYRRLDAGKIRDQVREHLRLFEENAEKGLDGRLDNLNDRIDDLRKMLDELVDRAKQLSREAEQER